MEVRRKQLSLTDTETPLSPNYSVSVVIIVYILTVGSKEDFKNPY